MPSHRALLIPSQPSMNTPTITPDRGHTPTSASPPLRRTRTSDAPELGHPIGTAPEHRPSEGALLGTIEADVSG